MSAILSAKHFHDEEAAYAYVEARLWKDGRDCPHCGVIGNSVKLKGKSTRIGTYKCRDCRKPFSVKVNTVFEASHVKLHIWLQAIHLLASSKKGFSTNQFARTLDISLKAAWFISMRLREAMKSVDLIPFGIQGGAVEADETFFLQNPDAAPTRGPLHSMNAILTLIDRDTKQSRSFVLDKVNSEEVGKIIEANVSREAHLMTDDARHMKPIGKKFARHGVVNHNADEYVSRADANVHTQQVENYYRVMKMGLRGVYQHVSRKHLHRYAGEYSFRYNNRSALGVDDQSRADRLLMAVRGKRLTYEPIDGRRSGSLTG